MEKELSTPGSPPDMASFEGKYPGDLFNKRFAIDNQTLGHVAKDAGDIVVVFTDSNQRYDIPRSEIISEGGEVTLHNPGTLENFRRDMDSPLPQEKLRPSADEIRRSAQSLVQEKDAGTITTPDAIMQEAGHLSSSPRPQTISVSVPENYREPDEGELTKQMKRALRELKELLRAGSKVAAKKTQEAKERSSQKRAEMDAEKIANMGDLALYFTESYEKLLAEARLRPYSEQAKIYDGLITLLDSQRSLVTARRDMAMRFQAALADQEVQTDEGSTKPKGKYKQTKTKRYRTAAA